MKNLLSIRHLSYSYLVIWMLTSAMCQRDQRDYPAPQKGQPKEQFGTFEEPLALELSYEVETVSYQKTDAPDDNVDPLDAIRAMPIVERQKVELKVFKDGTTEWLIEQQRPKNPAPDRYDPEVPLDPDPDIATIKIKKGTAYFYDDKGNSFGEPYSFPAGTTPNFKKLIEALKKDSCFNKNTVLLRTARLAPKPSGCKIDYSQYERVIDLGKGLVELIPKPKPSKPNARVYSQDELVSIDYADTIRNLYLGSELFGKDDDKLVMRIYFYYTAGNNPTLKRTHQELYDYSEDSQAPTTLIVDSFYDNVSIINHLTP